MHCHTAAYHSITEANQKQVKLVMMGSISNKLVVVLVVALAMAMLTFEGSRAITFCNLNEAGQDACKPSVTKPDPKDPTRECCKALSKADLGCLCSYKNSMLLPAAGIDPDLAMGLPAKCGLTPPANC